MAFVSTSKYQVLSIGEDTECTTSTLGQDLEVRNHASQAANLGSSSPACYFWMADYTIAQPVISRQGYTVFISASSTTDLHHNYYPEASCSCSACTMFLRLASAKACVKCVYGAMKQ